MLSKMAKPIFKTDDLDKCKLPELKEIARQRGLRLPLQLPCLQLPHLLPLP